MSHEFAVPGLQGWESRPIRGAREVSPKYREALGRQVLHQEKSGDSTVTFFRGARLNLGPAAPNVYLRPSEVDTNGVYSNFDILAKNVRLDDPAIDNVPATLLEVDSYSDKLMKPDSIAYREHINRLSGPEKEIYIRPRFTGSDYFPRPLIPGPDNKADQKHLELVTQAAGIHEPMRTVRVGEPYKEIDRTIEAPDIRTISAREYLIGGKDTVYMYSIFLTNDIWAAYELFTPKPIGDMSKDNLLVRVDSGCNIGHHYNDRGCDCREQFQTTMTQMLRKGEGAVLHIAPHDARGYGDAMKLWTEDLKEQGMDTIAAAKHALGDNFDLRDYMGAARILRAVEADRIILETDNRIKFGDLTKGGLDVVRKATDTNPTNGSAEHVAAKHRYNQIYF